MTHNIDSTLHAQSTAGHGRRRAPLVLMLLIGTALLFSSGCVYFNTFYHAKKYYAQGEKARKGVATHSAISAGKNYYLDAIEKANKVVDKHPKSKYHDDALFMIGMSYFHIANFTKSESAFRELLATHPQSGYTEEARLYLARCRIELGDERAGFRAFTELAETARKPAWRAEALFQRGHYFFEHEEYDSAQVEFSRVVKEYKNSDRAIEARLLAAQSWRLLGQPRDALALYRPLLDDDERPDLQFEALHGIGETYYEAGQPDSGIAVFESLVEDDRFQDSIGVIRLALAKGLQDVGDVDGAWRQYERVAAALEHSRFSAEAYFRMAEIKQYNERDLITAKDLYDQSRSEQMSGGLSQEALTRSANITRLEQFRQELGRGSLSSPTGMGGDDSYVYNRDLLPRLERLAPWSPPEARPAFVPWVSMPADSLEFVLGPPTPTEEELAAMTSGVPEQQAPEVAAEEYGPPIELAPTFGPPLDSADIRYNIRHNTLLPDWSWQSLVGSDSTQGPPAPAYVYEFGAKNLLGPATPPDSILHRPLEVAVVDTAAARRKAEQEAEHDAHMKELESIKASASTQLQLAELYRFSLASPESALVEYDKMVDAYPNTHYAAKALLGAADVLQYDLGDTVAAKVHLKRILREYPYTDYAGVAIARLGLKGTVADTAYPALYYEQAENAFLVDDNPRKAVDMLEEFTVRYPESRLVANAEWAIAALNEVYFPTGDSTIYYAYQEIEQGQAGTQFAQAAAEKLSFVVKRPKRRQRISQDQALALAGDQAIDSTDSVDVGASLPRAPSAQFLPGRLKKAGDFVFPESEIGTFTKESRVVYKILINFNGEISEYSLLQGTDSPDINEAARLAIENTVFNPDSIPVDSLNMYYRYDLRILPPARDRNDDEFRRLGIDPINDRR